MIVDTGGGGRLPRGACPYPTERSRKSGWHQLGILKPAPCWLHQHELPPLRGGGDCLTHPPGSVVGTFYGEVKWPDGHSNQHQTQLFSRICYTGQEPIAMGHRVCWKVTRARSDTCPWYASLLRGNDRPSTAARADGARGMPPRPMAAAAHGRSASRDASLWNCSHKNTYFHGGYLRGLPSPRRRAIL